MTRLSNINVTILQLCAKIISIKHEYTNANMIYHIIIFILLVQKHNNHNFKDD